MKHNAVVRAARPALVFRSPRTRAAPWRLRITLRQTHSWTKKIIKLGSALTGDRRLKPCAGGSNSLNCSSLVPLNAASAPIPDRMRRRAQEPNALIAQVCRDKDFEVTMCGCLVNTNLGPHERTPSWKGEDVCSVCDVLPFPNSLRESLKAQG